MHDGVLCIAFQYNSCEYSKQIFNTVSIHDCLKYIAYNERIQLTQSI